MNKKILLITPFLLVSILSGCKKQNNSPVKPDTPTEDDPTPPEVKDEFVKVTGERAKTIFDSLNEINEKMDNFEGSYTVRSVDVDSTTFTTYDATTKRYLDITKRDDETSRTIVSTIENDALNGICYSDKLDSEEKYIDESARFVNVTLDYGRCQRGADTDMSFPSYDALNALLDHPDLYSKVMFAEFSEEAGMTILPKNATYGFDVFENKVTGRFAFSMKTAASGYVEGDTKQEPVIDIDVQMYLEGDTEFIYSIKSNMKMTMYMGPKPVTQNIDSNRTITKEFDEETYNAFVYSVEKPETITPYYFNYVTFYYNDMYNYFYVTQLKPGSNFDLVTVKNLVENSVPGLKIDKIYYDAEHTREFKGLSSLYYYYTDLYITAGPKDGYVEVQQNFLTKYENSDDKIDIPGDYTPEELEIVKSLYPEEITSSEPESIYLNSYFYQKSEVSSAGIPIEFASSRYSSMPYQHIYLEDSKTDYLKTTIDYDSEKSVYHVNLNRTIVDYRSGSSAKSAIRLIDDYGDYRESWSVLNVDLGHMYKDNHLYFSLDTSKYDFWGKEVHFIHLTDKSDYSDNIAIDASSFSLKCYYLDEKGKKVDLEVSGIDVYDVPANETIYFDVTALADLPTFAVMQLY
jgi:hypothetical protein